MSQELEEKVARQLHESCVQQDLTGYLDAKIDCSILARAALAVVREAMAEPTPTDGFNYRQQVRADLAEVARRIPEDFPNHASWDVMLPAGHWRELFAMLSASPLGTPEGGAK